MASRASNLTLHWDRHRKLQVPIMQFSQAVTIMISPNEKRCQCPLSPTSHLSARFCRNRSTSARASRKHRHFWGKLSPYSAESFPFRTQCERIFVLQTLLKRNKAARAKQEGIQHPKQPRQNRPKSEPCPGTRSDDFWRTITPLRVCLS
jgi:hypothetical protein